MEIMNYLGCIRQMVVRFPSSFRYRVSFLVQGKRVFNVEGWNRVSMVESNSMGDGRGGPVSWRIPAAMGKLANRV